MPSQIHNFLQLSEQIGTGGQPTAEQFAHLQQAGYEVVINLALPDSPQALPDERAVVESQGMNYIQIPVEFDNPKLTDAELFLEAMAANENQQVFVHCVANMRVSAFMYVYRVLQQGVNEAVARQDLNKIWQPNQTWQSWIDQMINSPEMRA